MKGQILTGGIFMGMAAGWVVVALWYREGVWGVLAIAPFLFGGIAASTGSYEERR